EIAQTTRETIQVSAFKMTKRHYCTPQFNQCYPGGSYYSCGVSVELIAAPSTAAPMRSLAL
ncbi:MAG TPA: hypothetical protein VJ728_16370, partial [Candidatus Binataceae bacterium]|nr:hypothetical protein [Candidatus Binataceae bacterium]